MKASRLKKIRSTLSNNKGAKVAPETLFPSMKDAGRPAIPRPHAGKPAMVEADAIEPPGRAAANQTTSSVPGHTQALRRQERHGGGGRNRTDDLMLAKHALSQLSYAPLFIRRIAGLARKRSIFGLARKRSIFD